jgi:hypothetical protein
VRAGLEPSLAVCGILSLVKFPTGRYQRGLASVRVVSRMGVWLDDGLTEYPHVLHVYKQGLS